LSVAELHIWGGAHNWPAGLFDDLDYADGSEVVLAQSIQIHIELCLYRYATGVSSTRNENQLTQKFSYSMLGQIASYVFLHSSLAVKERNT